MFEYTKILINLISKYTIFNIFLVIFFSYFNNILASDLDNLFLKLKNSPDKTIAKQYENKIWKHWLTDGSNEKSNLQMQRGVNLLQSGELQDALQIFKNLSKKEPFWAEPINKIATIKFLMGDYLGSVNDIQLTLQLEPRHFGAISGLVQINMFFKNYSEALKNLDYVILINPFINIQQIRPDILKLIKKSSI
jgi:tetratricopeptide (TPR) repeat protein